MFGVGRKRKCLDQPNLKKMMERKSEEIVVEEMKCFQKCDHVCTYIHTHTHKHSISLK